MSKGLVVILAALCACVLATSARAAAPANPFDGAGVFVDDPLNLPGPWGLADELEKNHFTWVAFHLTNGFVQEPLDPMWVSVFRAHGIRVLQPTLPAALATYGAATPPFVLPIDFTSWRNAGFDLLAQAYYNQFPKWYRPDMTVQHARARGLAGRPRASRDRRLLQVPRGELRAAAGGAADARVLGLPRRSGDGGRLRGARAARPRHSRIGSRHA